MNRKLGVLAVIAIAAVALFALSAFATDAQMYFSSDKNGQNRVTNIQEGDEIWIVVIDNDKNDDCDIRDKMSPDLKLMDPKTGAYIVWDGVPGAADPTAHDYLEETGADTGVFVSVRAFQVGTRESYASGEPHYFTHVVDRVTLNDFQFCHILGITSAVDEALDPILKVLRCVHRLGRSSFRPRFQVESPSRQLFKCVQQLFCFAIGIVEMRGNS